MFHIDVSQKQTILGGKSTETRRRVAPPFSGSAYKAPPVPSWEQPFEKLQPGRRMAALSDESERTGLRWGGPGCPRGPQVTMSLYLCIYI